MAINEEIKAKVDELAEIAKQQAELEVKNSELKAFFQRLAAEDLQDTKRKTAEYWGSENARVTVTTSATVKPVSMVAVKNLLGKAYPDFVKEDVAYRMTEPCKRFFAAAFLGDYVDGQTSELIRQISNDAKIQEVLKKRLKGRYDKDKAMLMKVVGIPEQEASDWAYLAAEIINWELITQILKDADWGGSVRDAIMHIRASVTVEESYKVAVTAE